MIDIENLSANFTGIPLFENVNLKINKGDRICLVGVNGSGKSTFLKILAGIEVPASGQVRKQKGIRIGYLPQEIIDFENHKLFDYVKNSLYLVKQITKEENAINSLLAKGIELEKNADLRERLARLNSLKETHNYYALDSEIKKSLIGLGFKESDFERRLDEFSGGWKMRAELAKILVDENDILLMDEPTNHLDIDSLEWLIGFLQNYRGALLIVSHDKDFILKVTNKTLEIFNGRINFYKGNLDEYLSFKSEREKTLEAERRKIEQKRKETERFIERFRYKATKAKQVQSRIKMLEKLEDVADEEENKTIEIRFPTPPRAGAVVVELNNISFAYDKNKVFENISLKIERGEKLAFVGPNGAGKSTLSKLIAGRLEPTSGKITYGHNVKIAFYSQEVADNLDFEKSVLETMTTAGSSLSEGRLRSILGAFLFSGDDVYKKVKVLSGGEKSRLALAKLLLSEANLLVLDEPTNHLDYDSKAVLKKALINFPGAIVIVTHDVDFLRGLAEKVLDIRIGKIKTYYGDVDYYLSKKFYEAEATPKQNEREKVSSRKERKRAEAELRTEKFRATQGLRNKISELEEKIEKLEEYKNNLEHELGKSEVFSNPQLAKEKNEAYKKTKEELESAYDEWSLLNEELEKLELEFQKRFELLKN